VVVWSNRLCGVVLVSPVWGCVWVISAPLIISNIRVVVCGFSMRDKPEYGIHRRSLLGRVFWGVELSSVSAVKPVSF